MRPRKSNGDDQGNATQQPEPNPDGQQPPEPGPNDQNPPETPSSFDLDTKPISLNPTKEIETPILSFDEMLDRKAEPSIRLGTGITGKKLHNIAFNQDVAPYLQSTELSSVFFVIAKGVYYRPFALDIL